MCCGTHPGRDQLDIQEAISNKTVAAWRYADDERLRCQCSYGNPCKRRMTREDLLCDWCRDTDHDEWCREHERAAGGFVPRVILARPDPSRLSPFE